MNPIELGRAIGEVGVPVITAMMLILVVGLVWYLIKRQTNREDKQDIERTEKQNEYDDGQKEDRAYFRGLLTNELKDLQKNSQKNIELNKKSVMIQDRTAKNLATMTEAVRNTLDMSNGGNPIVKKILKRLDKIEKPLDK